MNQQASKALQSGAVLVVSLVMLLILTLIGVSGMSSVTLEEKMGILKQMGTMDSMRGGLLKTKI